MFTKGTSAWIKDWDTMESEYGLTDEGNIDTDGLLFFPASEKHLCGKEVVIGYVRDTGAGLLYECFLRDTSEMITFYLTDAALMLNE